MRLTLCSKPLGATWLQLGSRAAHGLSQLRLLIDSETS